MIRWVSKAIRTGGTVVGEGLYLSIPDAEFHVHSNADTPLPGEPTHKYVQVPWPVVPFLFPILGTIFMMCVPSIAVYGAFLWFKKRRALKCLLIFTILASPGSGRAEVKPANDECLGCHAKSQTHFTFQDQTTLSRRIDSVRFYENDVHAAKVACRDCHEDYSAKHHPQIRTFASLKEYRLARYELCRKCHELQYQQLKGSLHFSLLSKGDLKPPVCTDCHSVHNIRSYKTSHLRIVEKCKECHPKIFEVYQTSIHGRALLEEKNRDVPTCIDCHKAHQIEDPRTFEHKLVTPDICGRCHNNETLMSKYGLRADTYKTYLDDFHGTTIQLMSRTGEKPQAERITAICSDCHGYHNIQSTKTATGSIDRAAITHMCQRCHPSVPENFSSAWLSHYRPSIKHHPIIFMVKAFYWFFMPFTMIGLAIHMVTHFRQYRKKGKEDEHSKEA